MHITIRNAGRTRLVAGLVVGILSCGLLASCSHSAGSKTTSSSAGGVAVKAAPAAAPVNGAFAGADSARGAVASSVTAEPALQSRDIVRTATLGIEVADVNKSANSLTATVTKFGGRVDQDNRTDSGSPTAQLVLRLVPDRLDQAMSSAASLGHETSQSVSGQDVTASVADVGARVSALQTSVRRLQALLGSSANLPDLISLESQLTQRQATLDSTVAQQRALSDQVTLASLTVNLSTPAALLAAKKKTSHHVTGFASALSSGGHAAAVTVRVVLAGLGYSLPFLVVFALLGGGWGWLRHRRRGSKVAAQPGPTVT